MSSNVCFPGPSNPELLFLGQQHRAARVFYNQNSETEKTLTIRRCDQSFFEHLRNNPIPNEVMHYIRLAGFGGIFQCGYHRVDRALITALVERWRPETHTFHLPIGEATITLQDIQVLWGLNVDGNVVTGIDSMNLDTILDLCHNFLGFTPSEDYIRGSTIRIPVLIEMLNNHLPQQPTVEQLQQRARLYILILIGGILFSDLSGNRVSLFYLYNIISLEDSGTLSWGSAVLAYLYRCLCRATNPEVTEVTGPLVLVQIWAWERIRVFRPEIRTSNYGFLQPYAARSVIYYISCK